ncbi:hypothetical protein CD351_02850 [Erythrobacter sp. KY5]|uniref:hypothetical protein n=1 Tax=Erythrobacter sp. KY5 TaxID=2011159 RepID=UPI000DBF0BB5|nr:hypothetical protein [Erythrobacter sp. KY5]AWW73362.1 hypothetical protein CD351_02850 [Erythrobacter sp. KY5]
MLAKLALLGAVGFAGYKLYQNSQVDQNGVAFADGEPKGAFRNAGAEATGTKGDTMTDQDEALDATFPASDATAKY